MSEHFSPKFKAEEYHCPFCHVYAHQEWSEPHNPFAVGNVFRGLWGASCKRCNKNTYWFDGKLIYPEQNLVESPHESMPEELKIDYHEAAAVFNKSPKSSAALIRLVLQKLMVHLGERGKDINDDIGKLVNKGLPQDVQQAMDICRIVGNKAVHPGEIDLNDTPDIAAAMFALINYIVEDQIARPNKLKALYAILPEGAKEGIEKRDKKVGE